MAPTETKDGMTEIGTQLADLRVAIGSMSDNIISSISSRSNFHDPQVGIFHARQNSSGQDFDRKVVGEQDMSCEVSKRGQDLQDVRFEETQLLSREEAESPCAGFSWTRSHAVR